MASQPMTHHISKLTEIKITLVNVCEGIKHGSLHIMAYTYAIVLNYQQAVMQYKGAA